MTPGKGSKYREFYDLSGRITCMIGSSPISSVLSAVPFAYFESFLRSKAALDQL